MQANNWHPLGKIAELFREELGVSLSQRTISHFARQAKRLGFENDSDFVASVLLECLQDREISPLDDNAVFRAVDRISHRLLRRLKHPVHSAGDTFEHLPNHQQSERELTQVLQQLRRELLSLSITHLLILDRHLLQGVPIQKLAVEIGISERTLYRRLDEVQETVYQVISDRPAPDS